MSTSSSSPSSDEELIFNPNPIPKPIDDELTLASLTLTESNGNGSVGESDRYGGAGVVLEAEREGEREGPSSPSSSGYAGERGSSSEGTSNSRIGDEDDDGIQEVINDHDGFVDGVGDSSPSASWVPGKRHVDEDDASISWRKRKKHFFILSHSGKPIYSRYGDEHKLAGFSATLQAIISFVENGKDRIKLVRAGKHQMILILTKSINRCFEKNPKFDMTPLLGGTDVVFSSLIHSFNWNPATFLHAYTCLPLAYATRQAAGAVLQDVADSGVLFALLMCKCKVVSLVGAQKASLHPDDMLLLSNFVMSSESFRTSESFSPICLPRYNPTAFLYAYVHYFDADTYLMLLTTSSDAFYHLKDCRVCFILIQRNNNLAFDVTNKGSSCVATVVRIRIEQVLLRSNVLSEVQRSMLEGGMRVEDLPVDPLPRSSMPHRLSQQRILTQSPEIFSESIVGIGGPTGLWHFIYRSIYLDQYVSSDFSPPISSPQQQKRLYRAYQKLYCSMHDKGIGPHKTQFRRDENYVLLCWVTQDFELYAAFDPLADKV
ncbi:vacuolar fusion protein MON1-like [Citrus sinensis]|uniref:Vacuolar fusion protein MON1-like n=1 Tax=Citrus sinensis TaxID=2711 RepID=A0ACB8IUI8_CITSI|nr:vacuolar fusion protein MON1-like [Citrus sinensis]